MEFVKLSKQPRNHLALATFFIASLLVSVGHGEAVSTVNGVEIERSVFEFYLESRLQRPLVQVSATERELVLQELADIYA
jgi:hypothetical protein